MQEDQPTCKLPAEPWLPNQESPLEGHRKQRRLQNYNSLPVFFLPLIHSSRHSSRSHLTSTLLTFSLPFFLFHFLTYFPLITLEHLPSPSPIPRLILSVSRTCRLLWHPLFLRFCLHHPLSSFSCEECPVSPLSHQQRRTVGPIFSLGVPPLIRVAARFFPMAEHKTSSLLLGTNPLHPGLSNGLEGAMRLAVYPLQLERSPPLSLFILASFCLWPLRPSHLVHFRTTLPLYHHGRLHHPSFCYRCWLALPQRQLSICYSTYSQIHQPRRFNWEHSSAQIDRRRSSGFNRKHTNMTHTSHLNASAAILLCPRRSTWVTASHTETGWEHRKPSKRTLWDLCYNTFSVWHTNTGALCVSFLSLHVTSLNVVTAGVRSAGASNKDTSS